MWARYHGQLSYKVCRNPSEAAGGEVKVDRSKRIALEKDISYFEKK